MPMFSARSKERLSSCHPDLQTLFEEVIKDFDCTILVGHRGEKEQNTAVNEGKSTKFWPNSMHNSTPSLAVDVAPFPLAWKDIQKFYYFAGFVMGKAHNLGLKIRWGGDWDCDKDLHDQHLNDLVHFELVNPVLHTVASKQP